MLTLFGNLDSGNVHKVQMILARRHIQFRRVDVRQDRGEPRDPRYLAVNSMGKVPAVKFEDGDVLSDSGALLFYFSQGTGLWPDDVRLQAEVLRWMLFEQYSHEPALAVLRYLLRFDGDPDRHTLRISELRSRANLALEVMAGRLARHDWIAADTPTIADLALYPYTSLAGEIDMDLASWPAVGRWLTRVECLPDFLPLYTDAAAEVVGFDDYFGPPEECRQ